MKEKIGFFSFIMFSFLVLSCTDSKKIKYNESRNIPFEHSFEGPEYYGWTALSESQVKSIFNIPADGKVENFSITGFNLVISPDILSPADYIDYKIGYSYTDDPGYFYYILEQENVDARYNNDIDINKNLSNRLNGNHLKALSCVIGKMISAKKLDAVCSRETLGQIKVEYRAKLKDGTSSIFKGTVTGYLGAQVEYSVCESLPEGIFSSGLESCD